MLLSEIVSRVLDQRLQLGLQVDHQVLQTRIDKDRLLLQPQAVVPLVDLTFADGQYVDITPSILRVVMDHLDEVELLILLLVVQACAHVNKVDVFSTEGGHFALHVQVFEQCEVVRFEHTEDVAN